MSRLLSSLGLLSYVLLAALALLWWAPNFFAVNLHRWPDLDYRYVAATGVPYALLLISVAARQSLMPRFSVQLVFQVVLAGLALFLDAAKGSNDFDMATVGVRYYFGANKSLIQRHRQDDPDNLLIEAMTSGQQQYQQRKDAAAAAAVTPACPPMSVACI